MIFFSKLIGHTVKKCDIWKNIVLFSKCYHDFCQCISSVLLGGSIKESYMNGGLTTEYVESICSRNLYKIKIRHGETKCGPYKRD